MDNPCELTGAILSMLTFVCDIVTDILVATFYFHHNHYNWGALTLMLIIIPGWIVSFFSWCWQKEDAEAKINAKRVSCVVFSPTVALLSYNGRFGQTRTRPSGKLFEIVPRCFNVTLDRRRV